MLRAIQLQGLDKWTLRHWFSGSLYQVRVRVSLAFIIIFLFFPPQSAFNNFPKISKECAVWLSTMSGRKPTAGDWWYGPVLVQNHHIHQGNRIRVQVSCFILSDPPFNINLPSINFTHFCRATSGKVEGKDVPGMGLVRDGTSCGDNLVINKILLSINYKPFHGISFSFQICVNQTCTNVFPHEDQGKCPSNQHNLECSGNGVSNSSKQWHYGAHSTVTSIIQNSL